MSKYETYKQLYANTRYSLDQIAVMLDATLDEVLGFEERLFLEVANAPPLCGKELEDYTNQLLAKNK